MCSEKEECVLDIVVVNWNSGQQLVNCVDTIFNYSKNIKFSLVIVDNASTDGSISGIESLFPNAIIINNLKNKGFAAACNQGAGRCNSRYLLFLNPDTKLKSDSLRWPLTFMDAPDNYNYGVCGIQMINEKGHLSPSCARIPGLADFIFDMLGITKVFPRGPFGLFLNIRDHKESRDVDHVIGAFYFIRRSVFKEMDGFDERFFVYLEDVDLSARILKKGYNIRYIIDAQCFHKGGGTSALIKDLRLFYFLKSKVLYGFKHFSLFTAWILFLSVYLIEPFTRIVYSMLSGSFKQIRDIAAAYFLLYSETPGILKTARQKI